MPHRHQPVAGHRPSTPATGGKYDFLIVENDIYADLDPSGQQTLAGMDQLARVIYIGSFSKTIAPALRIGFIAVHQELIDELVPLKMVSGLTTSSIAEELVLDVLMQGRHRKHVKQLQANLARAHETVVHQLEAVGMEVFAKPYAGLFLWAHHPLIEDSTQLAIKARDEKFCSRLDNCSCRTLAWCIGYASMWPIR
ncbi:aminotransferase class I/II-fold pyridoxal phosphate-dependent enzyme [Pseudomonas gingeri]